MQEKPTENCGPKEKDREPADDPTWERDQKERGYYYDDTYGYEKYEPQDETGEDADEET
jgi:hypothetical protein